MKPEHDQLVEIGDEDGHGRVEREGPDCRRLGGHSDKKRHGIGDGTTRVMSSKGYGYLIVMLGPASSRVTAVLLSTLSVVDVLSQALRIMKTSSTPIDSTKKRAATIMDWNLRPKKLRIPVEERRASKGMIHPIIDSQGFDRSGSLLEEPEWREEKAIPSGKDQYKEYHGHDGTDNQRSSLHSHFTYFGGYQGVSRRFTLNTSCLPSIPVPTSNRSNSLKEFLASCSHR